MLNNLHWKHVIRTGGILLFTGLFVGSVFGQSVPEPPYEAGDIINPNGSFQHDDIGETDPAYWDFYTASESSWEVVSEAQDGDDRALRFEVEYSGNDQWHENEITNLPINVVEGEKYRVSAWLKADHHQDVIARVWISMPEEGDYERARGWSTPWSYIDADWQKVEFEFTATGDNETHGMRLGIELNHEDNDGAVVYIDKGQVEVLGDVTSSDNNMLNRPRVFRLNGNYPNPFNPTTTISYDVPKNAHVSINVYNMLGQPVMSLVNEKQTQGVHTVNFDAGNLSSGMYIYRMEAGTFSQTKKMMLVK